MELEGKGKGVFGKGNIVVPEFTYELIDVFSKGFLEESNSILNEDTWEIYYDGEGIALSIGGIEIALFDLVRGIDEERCDIISEEDLKTLGKLIDFLKEVFEEKKAVLKWRREREAKR